MLDIEPAGTVRALFFGLGADGTVGANKNSVKIIGADPGRNAQAYFVYDSKKSGSETVSHLRFGPAPIKAPYLISQASFVGCHQARMIARHEVLGRAAPGATVLLNTPYPADEVWDSLPREAQEQILAKQITLYAIDASKVARDAGLGKRANTVLQTCFFAISGVMPREEAIKAIKACDRQNLQPARPGGRRRQRRRGGRGSGGTAPGRAPRAGDRHPHRAAGRPGARAGVRPRRHRADDGRPR